MENKEIGTIFSEIIGETALSVVQTYGSFINIELGNDCCFFINMCNWTIFSNNVELAFDESNSEEIEKALSLFYNQKINKIILRPDENVTEIDFSFGGKILLSNKTYIDDVYEMWSYYTNTGYVLTYRNDQKIAYEMSTTEFDKSMFIAINKDVIVEEL